VIWYHNQYITFHCILYDSLSLPFYTIHIRSWYTIILEYPTIYHYNVRETWNITDYHGLSWIIMDYHGLSWIIMDYHGLSWIIMDYPLYCNLQNGRVFYWAYHIPLDIPSWIFPSWGLRAKSSVNAASGSNLGPWYSGLRWRGDGSHELIFGWLTTHM